MYKIPECCARWGPGRTDIISQWAHIQPGTGIEPAPDNAPWNLQRWFYHLPATSQKTDGRVVASKRVVFTEPRMSRLQVSITEKPSGAVPTLANGSTQHEWVRGMKQLVMSPRIYAVGGSGFSLWTRFLCSPMEEKSPPRTWLEDGHHGAGHRFGSPCPSPGGTTAGTPWAELPGWCLWKKSAAIAPKLHQCAGSCRTGESLQKSTTTVSNYWYDLKVF